jgi:hypothetical protein
MAAVEGRLFHGDCPGNLYGPTRRTIGWDEEDTRIRLSLIARAWTASRASTRPGNAYRAELVNKSNLIFFFLPRTNICHEAVHGFRRAVAAESLPQYSGVDPRTVRISNDIHRNYHRLLRLRGPADGNMGL